jgi:hypothetical protein
MASEEAHISQQQAVIEKRKAHVQLSLDIGSFAHWFLPIVGVIYSAGFLIVFTFSKSFGIDVAELFQGKYIHVGSLFMMAWLVVALPVFWALHARRMKAVTGRKISAMTAGLSLYALMLITFYAVVAFTERGFFHENAPRVLLNFVAPLGYSLLRFLLPTPSDPTKEKDEKDEKLAQLDFWLAIICLAAQVFAAYLTFTANVQSAPNSDALWYHLIKTFPFPRSGAYAFLCLVILTVLYVSAAAGRWRVSAEMRARLTILLSACCVTGMFLYLSILTFAYAIYPRIPSARGGGAYTDSVRVQISFREPPIDVDTISMARPDSQFIVLYQNSQSVFLASKADANAGGPEKWQEPRSTKPKVYEVRRETLKGIWYLNPVP